MCSLTKAHPIVRADSFTLKQVQFYQQKLKRVRVFHITLLVLWSVKILQINSFKPYAFMT